MSESKSDSKKEAPIPISVEDWRRLHTKEFMDTILGKVWGKIFAALGAGSIVAVLAVATTIFGPVQNMVVEKATRQVAQGIVEQLKKDVEEATKKVAQQFLNQELQRGGTLRQQLANNLNDILAGSNGSDGLVRAALIEEARQSFISANSAETSAYMFRFLNALDAEKSRKALADALQRRIEEGSESAEVRPLDQRFEWALDALAENKNSNVSVDQASELLRKIVNFLQYSSPQSSSSQQTRDLHDKLKNAAAKWLRTLNSEQGVADHLSHLIIPQARFTSGGFVALDLLLQQNTQASFTSIANFISARNSSDVDRLLRHLSTSSWPSEMEAQQVANIFFAFERRIPEGLVAPSWAQNSRLGVPNLLEARFVLMLPNSQGQGFQVANQLLPYANLEGRNRSSAVLPQHWRDPIQQIERNARPRPSARPYETTALVELPILLPNAEEFWPNLMRRVVDAILAGQALVQAQTRVDSFMRFVFDTSSGSQVPVEIGHRRMGLLALGIARASENSSPPPALDGFRDRLWRNLLNEDDVDSSLILGVALQRLLRGAKPETCLDLAKAAKAKATWINAALVACSAPSGREQFIEALVGRIDKISQSELDRMLAFIALSDRQLRVEALGRRPQDASQDTSRRVLQAIISGAGETGEMLESQFKAITKIRQAANDGLRRQLDEVLAESNLKLYPARSDLSRTALPDWAYEEYWRNAKEISSDSALNTQVSVSRGRPQLFKLSCKDQKEIVLQNITSGLKILKIFQGRVSLEDTSSVTGSSSSEKVLTPPDCGSEVLVLLKSETRTNVRFSAREQPIGVDLNAEIRLEPERPVRVILEENQSARFRLQLDPTRRYVAETFNLQGRTDTVLTLLDREDEKIVEDDDGGRGNASRLELDTREVRCGVTLSATGFEGRGGQFDLLLKEVGEVAPDDRIDLNQVIRIRVGRQQSVTRRLNLAAGATIEIRTENLQRGVDSVLTLLDPTGCKILGNDDDGGQRSEELASLLSFDAEEQGDYYLEIKNIGEDGEMNVIVRPLP